MRIYTRIREMLMAHKDVFIREEQAEKQLLKHDQKINLLFTYLSKFIKKEQQPRIEIGFKRFLFVHLQNRVMLLCIWVDNYVLTGG